MLTQEQQRLMEAAIAKLSGEGWEIVSRSERAIQVRRRKRWNVAGLVLLVLLPLLGGFLWAPLFAVSLVSFVVLTIIYLSSQDRLEYITIEDIEREQTEEEGSGFVERESREVVIAGVVALVAFIIFALLS